MLKSTKRKLQKKRDLTKQKNNRWYTDQLKSLLGNQWAMFYIILGGRMTGKSYSLADFFCNQKKKKKDKVQNYWLRISETSTKLMLANKAQGLIDADLVRKYNLELSTKGCHVYNRGEPFIDVMPLSQMAKTKGVAIFDKDFDGEINIVLDEFQLEQGERRTSFDILYNFIGTLENIIRTRKNKIRIFLVGNTLEEASTILKAFNFLPEAFGRFKLKRKRCVIDNLAPTEEYLKDREGSAADILGGKEMSNYSNSLSKDTSLISKQRLQHPEYLIKFSKQNNDIFVVCDNNVITRYKRQPVKHVIPMRPYLNERYAPEQCKAIIDRFDARAFSFDSLITLAYFEGALSKIRK